MTWLRSPALALLPLLLLPAAAAQAEPTRNGFGLASSSVPIREIHQGGPPRGGIGAVNSPTFVSAADAPWQGTDFVIGLLIGGRRARLSDLGARVARTGQRHRGRHSHPRIMMPALRQRARLRPPLGNGRFGVRRFRIGLPIRPSDVRPQNPELVVADRRSRHHRRIAR